MRIEDIRREIFNREVEAAGSLTEALDICNARLEAKGIKGFSQSYFSQIKKGGDDGGRNIGRSTLRKLEIGFGKDPGYFDKLPADLDVVSEKASTYDTIKARKLPVISSVQAGAWGDVIDPFEPGVAEEVQLVEDKYSPHAFVLRVEGDSMTSHRGGLSIPHGSKVVVEPEAQADNGSIVVAKLVGEERATVKKLVIDPPFKYLMPLNDQYNKIEINGECRIVGVVREVIIEVSL